MAYSLGAAVADDLDLIDNAGAAITGKGTGDFATHVAYLSSDETVTATLAIVERGGALAGSGKYRATFTPSVVGDWATLAIYAAGGVTRRLVGGPFTVVTAAQFDPAAALAAGTVTVTSPVATTGDVTVYQGDDYKAADSRSLSWATTDAGQWPDLTGATIALAATHRQSRSTVLAASGSVVTPTGATKQVRVELAHAVTAALRTGDYDLQVIATLAGSANVATLVEATLTVKERRG